MSVRFCIIVDRFFCRFLARLTADSCACSDT